MRASKGAKEKMQRENLRLKMTQPITCVVEETNAKETTSQYQDGVQWRYSVRTQNGPAYLYLDVDAHIAVRHAKVVPGDEIEIVKLMRAGKLTYNVRVVSDAHEQPETRYDQREPEPEPQPIRTVQPLAVRQPVVEVNPTEAMMQSLLVISGRANMNAYKQLIAEGFIVDAPLWDDIRSNAISMFIERAKQSREAR
jgi:hypothetical protein